jgi:hypothetical protein
MTPYLPSIKVTVRKINRLVKQSCPTIEIHPACYKNKNGKTNPV